MCSTTLYALWYRRRKNKFPPYPLLFFLLRSFLVEFWRTYRRIFGQTLEEFGKKIWRKFGRKTEEVWGGTLPFNSLYVLFSFEGGGNFSFRLLYMSYGITLLPPPIPWSHRGYLLLSYPPSSYTRGTRGYPRYRGYPRVPGVSGDTRGTRGYAGYRGAPGVSYGTRGYPRVPGGTRHTGGYPAYRGVPRGTRGTRGYMGYLHCFAPVQREKHETTNKVEALEAAEQQSPHRRSAP